PDNPCIAVPATTPPKVVENALTSDPTAQATSTIRSTFRRPYRSPSLAHRAAATADTRRQPVRIHPAFSGSPNTLTNLGIAAKIIDTSNADVISANTSAIRMGQVRMAGPCMVGLP